MTMLIKSAFALVLVLTLTAANHVTKKENPSSANKFTSTRLNIDNHLTSELLHLANKKSKSKEDYKQLVKLVKNPGVDVNAKDPLFLGATPLHLLFYHESNDTIPISFVKLLIKKGADINAKDDQTGAPPLFLLCSNYSGKNLNKLVKLLIEKGADVKATNSFGWRLENFPKCRNFAKK